MSTIYTIGYEGTDIDRFVTTLKVVGVQTLADVRAVALSRKKGFSKSALSARLQSEGIAYRHFIDLGDPKPGRDAARAGDLASFSQIYTAHLERPAPQGALGALIQLAGTSSTCLLCFERNPDVCHRSIVAQRFPVGWAVFDLFGDAPDRYVRHETKLPRRHSRQSLPQSQQEIR